MPKCIDVGDLCLTASDLAAWVQAIGSLFAIAVAIAVPFWISQQDRRRVTAERAIRAKGYAYVLLPFVERLFSELGQVYFRLKREKYYLELENIAHGLREASKALDRPFEIHELGNAAHQVLDCLAAVEILASLLEEHESYLRHDGVMHDPETGEEYPLIEPRPYEPVLDHARSKIRSAVQTMRAMFDSEGH